MDVKLPDGRIIANVPEGTTQTELLRRVAKADNVAKLKTENPGEYDPQSKEWQDKYGATSGMDGPERVLAGLGKSVADLGRAAKRVGNAVGIGDYDQKAAQEDADLDKPLMDTTGGAWGKGIGDAAITLLPGLGVAGGVTRGTAAAARAVPGMLVKNPGVLARTLTGAGETLAPYIGAATSGAATGAVLSPEDMGRGAKLGAAMGAAGELGGRVVSSVYSGAKAAMEPLYEEGRKRILKRTLERFAKDPDAVIRAAENPEIFVQGSKPTLAQATMDPGIAQLERGAQVSPDVASALAEARSGRMGAYRSALDDMAGTDGRAAFHTAERSGNAAANYGAARAAPLEVTPEILATSESLLKRGSVQDAMTSARQLAREEGVDLGADAAGSIQGLHYIKTALDDQISEAKRLGKDKLAAAIKNTQDELVGMMQKASPQYGQAMAEYAAQSRPINQMAVGKVLRDTLVPPLGDFSPELARARGDQYAKLFRDPDKLAKEATGLHSATLAGTLEPEQLATATGIAKDLGRAAAAENLGKIPGSQTAQYLGAQNVLRQFLGPLGLPQSAFDSTLNRVASGVLSLPFKATQSETEAILGRAMADPQFAAAIMRGADPGPWIERYARPYMAQAAVQLGTD